MSRDFRGKNCVVTGAASGIGRCLSIALLEKGAVVFAVDRDEKALAALVEEQRRFGREVIPLAADVTDSKAIDRVLSEALKHAGAGSRVDVWVNNAGVSGIGDFGEQSVAEFQRVIDVNLGGVVIGTRVALAHMEAKGGGHIVNMASVAGHVVSPYLTAYCTAKHAVVGFTRALREELRMKSSSVKLLLVSPGFVATDMVKHAEVAFPEWLSWALGKPESVAKEIIAAIEKDRDEVAPTLNGRVMLGMNRLWRGSTRHGSKVLMARTLKDFLLNRYMTPGEKTYDPDAKP